MQKTQVVHHMGYRCIGPTITVKKINAYRSKLQSDRKLKQANVTLRILSGKSRLSILYLLMNEPELCVCDLADLLDISVSAVSHQLTLLRKHRLVETRRDAQTIYYSLTPEAVHRLKGIL